jgi:hypothetical protein
LEFKRTVRQFEEGLQVPFVSVLEKLAEERGEAKGRVESKLEAIESILDVRFGAEGVALIPRVRAIKDLTALSDLHRLAVTADLAAITARLPAEAP